MTRHSRLSLSLPLLLSLWLHLCLVWGLPGESAIIYSGDREASGSHDTTPVEERAYSKHDIPEPRSDGNPKVENALGLLRSIQQPTISLVRLSKRKGFVGSSLHYAKEAMNLLFLSNPSEPELSSQTISNAPVKLSSTLAKAVALLSDAASLQQSPDALWLLGDLNFHGNYTHPRNYTAAFGYYDQLARLDGNASAQHMLGFMYATGIGGAVKQDQARALLYHTFAADQGHIQSQMTIAYRHHIGISTPRNCEQAVKYYRQVAKKAVDYYKSGPPGGHVLVKNAHRIADEHGGPYGEGASVSSAGPNAKVGGPTSDAYADIGDVLEYLDFQSRKGDLRASFNLAKLYYDGARGMERDMGAAKGLFMQIARLYWSKSGKINADASATVEKLAPRAAGFLGRMFLRGEGTTQSYEKARVWFKRGIEYGDVLSQYSMGVMYMQGLGVPRDPIRASSYFTPAADHDMAVAQTDLGVLFLDQGDVNVARNYFELAVRSGHIEAYYYLAEMAHLGLGRDRQCGVAAAFYKIAAEKAEVINAPFIEANEAYEQGDMPKAITAYMMAAEQGYENAQANAAWLLDQTSPVYSLPNILRRIAPFIKSSTHSALDASLSLIYYTRSARQSNLDSLLKAGDMHLLGLGTSNSTTLTSLSSVEVSNNAAHAAACYTTASESLRSAQAMWNLGWMHETGIGVDKDYHLAKRYYDLALETNKEAYLPVKISLFKLRVRSWWNDVRGGDVRGISEEQRKPRGFWEWIDTFLENGRGVWGAAADDENAPRRTPEGADARPADENVYEADDWTDEDRRARRRAQREQQARERGADEFAGEYLANEELDDGLFESAGIIILAFLLGGLIWWRNQRRRGGVDERRGAGIVGAEMPPPGEGTVPDQGQGQGRAGDQRGGGALPGEMGYVQWDVPGGVGH